MATRFSKMIYLIILFIGFLLHTPSFGQKVEKDSACSIEKGRWVKFSIDGGGGNFYPVADRKISIPKYIQKERIFHDPYYSEVKEQTDEPFGHTALWARFGISARIFKKNTLNIALLGENRGESFGVFSVKHLILVPLINFQISDSIIVFNKKISITGKIGYLENILVDQGLMFYNIDAQGTNLCLRKANFAIQLIVLGDLISGIGLGIDDAISLAFKRYHVFSGKGSHNMSVSLLKLTRAPELSLFQNHIQPNLCYEFENKKWKADAQISMRFDSQKVPNSAIANIVALDRFAAKLGIEYGFEHKFFIMKSKVTFRYYGRYFNVDNYIANRFYRDFDKPISGNYLGSQLYPLKNYLYDFSQLAVFTEYGIRKVGVLSIVSQVELNIRNNLWFNTKIDFNLLVAEKLNPFLYPFYSTGLSLKLAKQVDCGLILTNKIMNLDVHYNTFYLTN